MYRLLIVEDEVWEREGLVGFLDWPGLNIEVVGTAANGVQGLQMAEKYSPDILMADIRMPMMDGLELSKEVIRILPGCRIILITGCDDFKYAQEAIHTGVYDYLLKPVQKEQLLDTLNRALEEICQENKQETYVHMLKERLTERSYDERERFLLSILGRNGQIPKDTTDAEGALYTFNFRNTVAIVIRMDGFPVQAGSCGIQRRFGTFFRTIREIVGDKGLTAVCDTGKNEIAICLPVTRGSRDEINDFLAEVQQGDYNEPPLEYVIGVGSLANSATEFQESFKCAQDALDQLFFMKEAKVLFSDDLLNQDVSQEAAYDFLHAAQECTKKLLNGVVSQSCEEVSSLTEELFDFIYSHPAGKSLVCSYLEGLVNELAILLSPVRDESNPVNDIQQGLPETFQRCIRLEQLKARISSLLIHANAFFTEKRKGREECMMHEAMDILRNEYAHCIGLEVLACRLGVSSSYLGGLFKKYTGKRFTDVLLELRMKKAEEMLASSDESIAGIAEAAGFGNASYFCTVFKKIHGASPRDYREKYSYGKKE